MGLSLLALSALNGVDNAFGLGEIPDVTMTSPYYFAIVYLQYLALMFVSWATAVGQSERVGMLSIVPLYPIYALAHLVPSSVGFLNWITVRVWGRRVYRDHYQPAMP